MWLGRINGQRKSCVSAGNVRTEKTSHIGGGPAIDSTTGKLIPAHFGLPCLLDHYGKLRSQSVDMMQYRTEAVEVDNK